MNYLTIVPPRWCYTFKYRKKTPLCVWKMKYILFMQSRMQSCRSLQVHGKSQVT